MQLKIKAANKWCLGGTMVWAVDLDDTDGTSTSDFLGLGKANGVSPSMALELKNNRRLAQVEATNINSCYWTFCGGKCASGYFEETYSDGQVNGVSSNTVCKNGDVETLCCATGTNTGTCEWTGWNGVGLSCSGECSNTVQKRSTSTDVTLGLVAIAFNTNSLSRIGQLTLDRTCNGGYQSYCCSGFKASPKGRVSTLDLVGSDGKETKPGQLDVGKFAGLTAACTVGATAAGTAAGTVAAVFSFGAAFYVAFTATFTAVFAACDVKAKEAATMKAVGVIAGVRTGKRVQKPPPRPKPKQPKLPTQPKPKVFGQWTSTSYDPKTDPDCAVTYTCRYGQGFDEICDNQSWGIYEANAGRTVYHYDARGPDAEYAKAEWGATYRKSWYRTMAQAGNPARCQVDEFPMGSLWEGRIPFSNQVCRLVNGPANRRQGTDWQQFLAAKWAPCSALRSALGKPDPPVTWEFDHQPGDPRLAANGVFPHFIKKYGFDSQTAGSLCWATYNPPNGGAPVTVPDHGFRALPNDPMYRNYQWPRQDYSTNPAVAQNLPQDVAIAAFLKRANVLGVLENKLPLEFADSAEEPIAVPCESCEVIVDETNKVVYDQRPVPDVPVTKVAAEASTTTGANRAKTGETVETAPIETGYSHRNARVRHRRSHGQKGVQKS